MQIYQFLTSLHPLVIFVSIAVFITVASQFIFLFNFIWSMFKGKRAGANPWDATTLEWATPSPPPHDNFGGVPPVVYRGAYEFAVPGAQEDFIMQTQPDVGEGDPGATGPKRGTGNGHNGHGH